MGQTRYADEEGNFLVTTTDGWKSEKDPEGGLLLHPPEGNGLLHLIPFSRDPEEEIDPGEELYAFLADQEIELEEQEVEDIALADGSTLALCEYATEDEEERVHWIIGVAATPGQLVFANYSSSAGADEADGEAVRGILSSLVLVAPWTAGGD